MFDQPKILSNYDEELRGLDRYRLKLRNEIANLREHRLQVKKSYSSTPEENVILAEYQSVIGKMQKLREKCSELQVKLSS